VFVLFLAASIAFILRLNSPEPDPEVPRDALILLNDRLHWISDTNRVFTGWMTETYSNGIPRSRSRVVDGRLNGLSEGWNAEGKIEVQESFLNGQADGLVTKWFPNGIKRSEGTAVGGSLQGTFRRWHSNGVLAEEITMDVGEPHGPARAWDEEGKLKAEVQMHRGTVVRQSRSEPVAEER